MALKIALIKLGTPPSPPEDGHIFVRDQGQTRTMTVEEWQQKYPGRTPMRLLATREADPLWHGTLSHTLAPMAQAANLYEALWCPQTVGRSTADQMVTVLRQGLAWLESAPDYFVNFELHIYRAHCGTYLDFVTFVRTYLEACRCYPDAHIQVVREMFHTERVPRRREPRG